MSKIFTLFIGISLLFSPLAMNAANGQSYLAETSKAFSNVGKKAIPAVVFIKASYNGTNYHSGSSQEYSDPFEYFHDELFKRFFNNPNGRGSNQPQYAAGSGCIVSKDGYILTNNHIVKDADSITVTLNNGHDYEAKVIGTDPKTDLAVIKINANNLPFLEFDDSDTLEIGEWVIAIGSPFQLQASLTVGVVSAKGRQNLRITDLEDFIQTDAAINPGNSGGPLLDLNAKIIGINTAIVSQTGGYMGIGFAIPSNMAKHVMEQIISNGSVKRGHLGIYLQPIDKDMAEALDLENTEAALIADVVKNSTSDKAGIKQGDIIIACNDVPVKNVPSLQTKIASMNPGDKVKLTILRNSKKINITVVLDQSTDSLSAGVKSADLGLEVSDIKDISSDILKKWHHSDNLEGVIITSVKYNSLAERAGIKPGMLILQINNQKINNINDFNKAISENKKKNLLLLVKYQNSTIFVTIKVK